MPDQATPLFGGQGQIGGAVQNVLHRQILLVAHHHFFGLAVPGDEDDEVADEVQQIAPVEQPVERDLHLVEFVDLVGPRVAPLQPELQAPPRHAVHHAGFVHAHAVGIGVEELVDLLRVHAELLGPLAPIGFAAAGGLGLDHDHRNAVDQQHDVRPAGRTTLHRKLVGHPPVVGVQIVVVDQPHVLRVLGGVELVIDAVLQPGQPLLIVAAAAQLGDDGIDPRIVGQDGGVQFFELFAQQRQQQHLALVWPVGLSAVRANGRSSPAWPLAGVR